MHVRDTIEGFQERYTEVLGIAPQDPEALRKYLEFHDLPFSILLDEDREVVRLYGVEHDVGPPRGVTAHPTGIIIDPEGIMRFINIGESSDDLPENEVLFEVLDEI